MVYRRLDRVPFHLTPWYSHRLWEAISQGGSSCEYISEQIIREATPQNGKLNFGPMYYSTLLLSDVHAMALETARAIQNS
ncbi:MAG: hypothetical protein HC880_14035 [Bacteroidia bacterium]|nr:hypothetical protein [Bacteroidia bacterium]